MFETITQHKPQIPGTSPVNRDQAFFKPMIQPKLAVNAPGDVYEQEADAMAEKVMRMKDVSSNEKTFFSAAPIVQRKCAACEEEEKMQRKESSPAQMTSSQQTENYISSLDGKGGNLGNNERNFFETRMGYDFSNVRIHTGADAHSSAQSMNAHAYTYRNNIVFANDQYQPATDAGKKLMAHELTHVIQQKAGIYPRRVQRLTTDEDLGARAEMASLAVGDCGTTVNNCSGRCRAADGSIGVCQWGGLKYGCRCRSNRGAEPAPVPVTRSVPWWVYALGGAAAIAIAACFATGVCEAGAIIAAVGEGAAAGIMALLRAAGILIAA